MVKYSICRPRRTIAADLGLHLRHTSVYRVLRLSHTEQLPAQSSEAVKKGEPAVPP